MCLERDRKWTLSGAADASFKWLLPLLFWLDVQTFLICGLVTSRQETNRKWPVCKVFCSKGSWLLLSRWEFVWHSHLLPMPFIRCKPVLPSFPFKLDSRCINSQNSAIYPKSSLLWKTWKRLPYSHLNFCVFSKKTTQLDILPGNSTSSFPLGLVGVAQR